MYFFSGVLVAFFGVEAEADDAVAVAEAGIVRSLRVARMQAVADQSHVCEKRTRGYLVPVGG